MLTFLSCAKCCLDPHMDIMGKPASQEWHTSELPHSHTDLEMESCFFLLGRVTSKRQQTGDARKALSGGGNGTHLQCPYKSNTREFWIHLLEQPSPVSSNKACRGQDLYPPSPCLHWDDDKWNTAPWRCVKSRWQQDSQGAFDLKLKKITSSRESRKDAWRMNRIAAWSSGP